MMASELRRAFSNGGFWAALAIGCLIAILHVVQFVIPEYREASQFPPSFPLTVFSRWLGGWGYPVHPALFYFIMPILVALPFSWSLFSDLKNGYCIQKATRATWLSYVTAKLAATFISGGFVVIIPLIVNFFGTACVLPLIQPDPIGLGAFMIFPYSFAAELFFSNATSYCLLFLFIAFSAAGVIACVALVLGCLMPNKALATLSAFIVCTVAAQTLKHTAWYSCVPTLFCMPGQDYGPLVPMHVAFFFLVSFLLIGGFLMWAAHGDHLR